MEYEYIRIPKVEDRTYSGFELKDEYILIRDKYEGYNKKIPQILFGLLFDKYLTDATSAEVNGVIPSGNNVIAFGVSLRKLLREVASQPVTSAFTYIQRIYYGAPGTGKSHKAKEVTNNKKVFRTTFHPDTDYTSFVGCYKPCVNNKSRVRNISGKVVAGEFDKRIEYSYTPQIFVKAYCEAWKQYLNGSSEQEIPVCKNVCLLIEELNRGNCAQIFGDLFQLLDRTQNGFSEYSILADSDLSKYIKEDSEIKDVFETYYNLIKENSDITDEGLPLIPDWDGTNSGNNEVRLCLPPNLSIVCTMNTSDQSLFPMDSAFKRRWDWEYVPIDYENEKSNFKIAIDETHQYLWPDFLKKINGIIEEETHSEDKQMGNFFVKADGEDKTVSCEQFVSKVMFYLWNDICKDNPKAKKVIFRYETEVDDSGTSKAESNKFSFNELFGKNEIDILIGFMKCHGIANIYNGISYTPEADDEMPNSESLAY